MIVTEFVAALTTPAPSKPLQPDAAARAASGSATNMLSLAPRTVDMEGPPQSVVAPAGGE